MLYLSMLFLFLAIMTATLSSHLFSITTNLGHTAFYVFMCAFTLTSIIHLLRRSSTGED